ncbi:cytokine-dependent hematopoietic cell linker-like [Narcine bancroftii]|uniref:cytokine-dependent hematopoietic cell linker-like n=1 Tax=Narcine bancroftii TaxID=1343680 RepID=UPI0038320771
MADSESEYDLPNEDENEHTNHNYEYEASPNLEGLRHVNICPAKPLNMPSVYADKRCLSMKPHLFNPKNSQLPRLGPQMQRGKSSSDSHLEFVAPGPVVDRTVKPSKTAKNSLDGPERSPKLPTRPLPRPPRAVPRCPEASHSYVSSGPDNSLHYLNMPPVKHSENDMGFWKNDQNKAFIARNGIGSRYRPDIISPVTQHLSLPKSLVSRSSSPTSFSNQTSQISENKMQSKEKFSFDMQKNNHFPSSGPKDLEGHRWYIGTCNRHKAEEALRIYNKNGAFLVRDSSKGIPDKPYVLLVYNNYKVYSIQIRYLERSKQYALGSGLRGHDVFESVPQIIENHKNIPLRLIDGRDQSGSQIELCVLTVPLMLH